MDAWTYLSPMGRAKLLFCALRWKAFRACTPLGTGYETAATISNGKLCERPWRPDHVGAGKKRTPPPPMWGLQLPASAADRSATEPRTGGLGSRNALCPSRNQRGAIPRHAQGLGGPTYQLLQAKRAMPEPVWRAGAKHLFIGAHKRALS